MKKNSLSEVWHEAKGIIDFNKYNKIKKIFLDELKSKKIVMDIDNSLNMALMKNEVVLARFSQSFMDEVILTLNGKTRECVDHIERSDGYETWSSPVFEIRELSEKEKKNRLNQLENLLVIEVLRNDKWDVFKKNRRILKDD